jgi:hypothetical protein
MVGSDSFENRTGGAPVGRVPRFFANSPLFTPKNSLQFTAWNRIFSVQTTVHRFLHF